jgi:hypothetical protein
MLRAMHMANVSVRIAMADHVRHNIREFRGYVA